MKLHFTNVQPTCQTFSLMLHPARLQSLFPRGNEKPQLQGASWTKLRNNLKAGHRQRDRSIVDDLVLPGGPSHGLPCPASLRLRQEWGGRLRTNLQVRRRLYNTALITLFHTKYRFQPDTEPWILILRKSEKMPLLMLRNWPTFWTEVHKRPREDEKLVSL